MSTIGKGSQPFPLDIVLQNPKGPDDFIDGTAKEFRTLYTELTHLIVNPGTLDAQQHLTALQAKCGEINILAQNILKTQPLFGTLSGDRIKKFMDLHASIKSNISIFQRQIIYPLMALNNMTSIKSTVDEKLTNTESDIAKLTSAPAKNDQEIAKLSANLNKLKKAQSKLESSINYLEKNKRSLFTSSLNNAKLYRDLVSLDALLIGMSELKISTPLTTNLKHNCQVSVTDSTCQQMIRDIDKYRDYCVQSISVRGGDVTPLETDSPHLQFLKMAALLKEAKIKKTLNNFELFELANTLNHFKPGETLVQKWESNEVKFKKNAQLVNEKQKEIEVKEGNIREIEAKLPSAQDLHVDMASGKVLKHADGKPILEGTRSDYQNQIKNIEKEIKGIEQEQDVFRKEMHQAQAVRNTNDMTVVTQYKKIEVEVIRQNALLLIENHIVPPSDTEIAAIKTQEDKINSMTEESKQKELHLLAVVQKQIDNIEDDDPDRENKLQALESKKNSGLTSIKFISQEGLNKAQEELNKMPYGILGSQYCKKLTTAYAQELK